MDCFIKTAITLSNITIASVHSLRSLGQLYGRISLRSKAAPINLPSMRGVMSSELNLDFMEGIDLQDSIILDWSISEKEFSIELEASIWPSSIHYFEPKLNEYTCYKKALLVFRGFNSILGLKLQKDVHTSRDPDGSLDYGNVDYLNKTDEGFVIEADFGNVKIMGGDIAFNIISKRK